MICFESHRLWEAGRAGTVILVSEYEMESL